MADILTKTHPDFDYMYLQWQKFRDVMEGGMRFVDKYLKSFSDRESSTDFQTRKSISYCAAQVKSNLFKIKNAMFQRFGDIVRSGGSSNYQKAMDGRGFGVDGEGSSMNAFMAKNIVEELLTMKRVGVYVDKDPLYDATTLAETKNTSPYMYAYSAEYIRSWSFNKHNELTSLLLQDQDYEVDEETGLIVDTKYSYRHLRLEGDHVSVTFYDDAGEETGSTFLELTRIPFVFFEIKQSLLQDVADYQVALTNLGSSDMSYALRANFPFYTEQYNPAIELPHIKEGDDAVADDAGSASSGSKPGDKNVKVGATVGRRYGKGLDRPAFIHPSSEPLAISIRKQEKLEKDIELMMGLNLASAGSRDETVSPEAGLSYVALILEYGENEIAKIWDMYNGSTSKPATVEYPERFYLVSDKDRQEEADKLSEMLPRIPSLEYQKAVSKRIVDLTIGNKIQHSTKENIYSEIDKATIIVIDPEVIRNDLELGLVSNELASTSRGYPDGEVEKAQEDRARRAAAIALAQSKANQAGVASMEAAGARGVDDLSTEPGEEAGREKENSQDHSQNVTKGTKKVRGDAE
jgi:hypothetical protein